MSLHEEESESQIGGVDLFFCLAIQSAGYRFRTNTKQILISPKPLVALKEKQIERLTKLNQSKNQSHRQT